MFLRNKKYLLPLFFGLVFGSLFFAHPAHAIFGLDYISDKAFNFLVEKAFYLIGSVVATVFTFGGFLIELALTLNSVILSLPAVEKGWEIVLSLTNLAFVLAIIIIAIATIIRNQSYGMKQLLWKLIVAAVLVNFSLVIAGVFLDFSGILTQIFVSKATPDFTVHGVSGFASQLAATLAPQKLLDVKEGTFTQIAGSTLSSAAASSKAEVSLILIVLFTLLAAIVMLGIATMLFVRFLFIAILLILAPIVWLGWIFPQFSQYWHKWWDNFIRWTFFAPASTFFLYLSIYTMTNGKSFFTDHLGTLSNSDGAKAFLNAAIFDGIAPIAQGLIAMGFMVASIMVAEQMGIAFAGTFRAATTAVGTGAINLAKKGGTFARNQALLSQKGRVEEWSKNADKYGFLGKRVRSLLSQPVIAAQQQERDAIKRKMDEIEKTPREYRALRQAGRLIKSETDLVADALVAAKEGRVKDISDTQVAMAKKYGHDKDITKATLVHSDDVSASRKKLEAAEQSGDKNAIDAAAAEFAGTLTKKLKGFSGSDYSNVKWDGVMQAAGSAQKEAIAQSIAEVSDANNFASILKQLKEAEKQELIALVKAKTPRSPALVRFLEKGVGSEALGAIAGEEGGGEKSQKERDAEQKRASEAKKSSIV